MRKPNFVSSALKSGITKIIIEEWFARIYAWLIACISDCFAKSYRQRSTLRFCKAVSSARAVWSSRILGIEIYGQFNIVTLNYIKRSFRFLHSFFGRNSLAEHINSDVDILRQCSFNVCRYLRIRHQIARRTIAAHRCSENYKFHTRLLNTCPIYCSLMLWKIRSEKRCLCTVCIKEISFAVYILVSVQRSAVTSYIICIVTVIIPTRFTVGVNEIIVGVLWLIYSVLSNAPDKNIFDAVVIRRTVIIPCYPAAVYIVECFAI